MSFDEEIEDNLLGDEASSKEETHSIYIDTQIEKDESLFLILKHIIGSILSQIIFGICYVSFLYFHHYLY